MKKKKVDFRSNCPISTTLDIMGDKWSLLIIRDMVFKGHTTYGAFLESDEHIATNILADRLAVLEWAGVISKNKHPDSKAKILYQLTQKGIDLVPILIEIIAWGDKHYDVSPRSKEFAKQIKKDKSGLIKMLMTGDS